MPQSSRKSEGTLTSFTVDADVSGVHEMPGITKLLNRKKLESSSTYTQSTPTTPPPFHPPTPPQTGVELSIQLESLGQTPLPVDPNPGISLSLEPAEISLPEATVVLSTPVTEPSAVTRPARAARPRSAAALEQWETASLKRSAEPLHKAICALADHGVKEILYFSPQQPGHSLTHSQINSPAAPLQFAATAALTQLPARLSLWQGIRWNMAKFPDLWQEFQNTGRVDFTAPGTVTQIQSTRNIMRTSLGLGSDASQHLTLLRVGSAKNPQGLIAAISASPLSEFPEALLTLQRSES